VNEDLKDKSENITCPWSHIKEMLLKIRQENISRKCCPFLVLFTA